VNPAQQQLALTYSVGEWVWAKANGHNNRRILARIESTQSLRTELGEAWLVRCYYSAQKRIARSGWSTSMEHRRVESRLNSAEVADLEKGGIIPAGGLR
jgi:hypothetical protein